MKSNKKTRTDKSEVAIQPTDPIHPVKLGAHSIYLSTGVGINCVADVKSYTIALPYIIASA